MRKKRIRKLQRLLFKNKIDGFLVTNPHNIYYLTGFIGLSPEERESYLLVTQDGWYLFTDGRYDIEKLKSSSSDSEGGKLKVLFLTPKKNLFTQITTIAQKEKIKDLAFESTDLKFAEYSFLKKSLNQIKLNSTNRLIIKSRESKDQTEIKRIKKACQIGDQCLKEIVKVIKTNMTEKEIAFRIEFWLKKKGYNLAFDPIVAIDKNSAIPHYNTHIGSGKVKKGSVILIDFGVKYKQYMSDMTRMIFVKPINQKTLNLYSSLLKIQKRTLKKAEKTTRADKVDYFCRQLVQKNLQVDIPHSIGHGVGLEIHEYPKIAPGSKELLINNSVFTVEPGVYFFGKFGFRIEDLVLKNNQGEIERLTIFPKKPLIIS